MTKKFEGKSGVSTMTLTREDTTVQFDTYDGGKKSVPAIKSVLTVDLDGDRKSDVRIEATSYEGARGFATVEYKGKAVDIMNMNTAVANQLAAAGVSFDGSAYLDPEDTKNLLRLAKDFARQGEFEQSLRR